ncbi:MAG: glycosyltransferase family 2 protein [Victivallaceae bacterium]
MNKKLKLSIITVTLNSEKHLEETIKSVLAQNYKHFEYIIIDGGSTDGTLDIIRKYEKNLAYWISEPDKGMYDAMNKGIARASGDIVGIINSDDYYFPGAFSKVTEAFVDESLDQYIFWGDIMQGDELVLGWRPWNLKRGAFAPHPSMFCPKKIYDRIGTYSLDYKVLGDYDFMYRAIHKYGIRPLYLHEPIAFFRLGGLASQNILTALKEELRVKLKYGQSFGIAYSMFLLKIIKNLPQILCNFKKEKNA